MTRVDSGAHFSEAGSRNNTLHITYKLTTSESTMPRGKSINERGGNLIGDVANTDKIGHYRVYSRRARTTSLHKLLTVISFIILPSVGADCTVPFIPTVRNGQRGDICVIPPYSVTFEMQMNDNDCKFLDRCCVPGIRLAYHGMTLRSYSYGKRCSQWETPGNYWNGNFNVLDHYRTGARGGERGCHVTLHFTVDDENIAPVVEYAANADAKGWLEIRSSSLPNANPCGNVKECAQELIFENTSTESNTNAGAELRIRADPHSATRADIGYGCYYRRLNVDIPPDWSSGFVIDPPCGYCKKLGGVFTINMILTNLGSDSTSSVPAVKFETRGYTAAHGPLFNYEGCWDWLQGDEYHIEGGTGLNIKGEPTTSSVCRLQFVLRPNGPRQDEPDFHIETGGSVKVEMSLQSSSPIRELEGYCDMQCEKTPAIIHGGRATAGIITLNRDCDKSSWYVLQRGVAIEGNLASLCWVEDFTSAPGSAPTP